MPGARRTRKQGGRGPTGKRDNRKRSGKQDIPSAQLDRFEAEVLPGLAPPAAKELERAGAKVGVASEDAVPFSYGGPIPDLLSLRRSVAVYRVHFFEVPRPKALLGHEHFSRLTAFIRDLTKVQRFEGFRIGAAGSDSPVFARFAAELEKATGLERNEEGELLLRFRPAGGGWEVLVRLTPRPLSARSWRRCNLPGGLNATVAASGFDLLGISNTERHLNLMCGSGTLLVERGLAGPWQQGVGLDIDARALECARQNLDAAGLAERSQLLEGNANALPFADGSFDRISVDLPWGDAIGGHEENARLYPTFLAESARVATNAARMLAITHEIRLLERALREQDSWRLVREPVRVFHGGHRPGLYLLVRSND